MYCLDLFLSEVKEPHLRVSIPIVIFGMKANLCFRKIVFFYPWNDETFPWKEYSPQQDMTTTTSSDKLTLIITCEFILCVGISKETLFHPSPHSKELCYRHFENSKKNLANYLIRRSSQYSLASVKKSFSDNDHQVYGLECLQKSIVIFFLSKFIWNWYRENLST